MLRNIKIEGLFNKFSYDIELKKEGITILTGPNGYGKTTILKIIHAFAIKNLAFFFQLPFEKILLIQENNEICLSKTGDTIEIQSGSALVPTSYKRNDESEHDKKQIPDIGNAYFIREQRLIKKREKKRGADRRRWELAAEEFAAGLNEENNFASTIEAYAKELSLNIKNTLSEASKIGQELDSSFPRRLFDETRQVSEAEFNDRYNIIREKQKSLSMYGLSVFKADSRTSFKEENAKALLVYLNDTEKKLAVFDDMLQRLELFSSILNERQFVFKQPEISPDFGFRFKTEDEKELSLTELSSGEQQEVVLLYELIFRVASDTLVLIDEPEISLHVAWQKEIINDLLNIIKLQKIAVITATHSPQIIGEHWDLVADLWELSGEN